MRATTAAIVASGLALLAASAPGAARSQPTGIAARWGTSGDHAAWTQAAYDAVSSLGPDLWKSGVAPSDIDDYCPGYAAQSDEGRKAFWVGLVSSLALYESGFDPANNYQETFKDEHGDYVVSRGLLQLSVGDCGIADADKLYDPATNIRCAVQLMDGYVRGDHRIAGRSPAGKWLGLARYWHPFRVDEDRARISAWTTAQAYCRPARGGPSPTFTEILPGAPLFPEVGSSGGVSAPAGAPPPPPAGGAPETRKLEIVRYVGADKSDWSDAPTGIDLSDLYTRLVVESADGRAGSTPGAQNFRDYDAEERGWLERLLVSQARTVTTIANIQIRSPDLTSTVPLFSVSHSSAKGTGETFVTNFTTSDVESPLFRMGANSAVTIHLNTKLNRDVQSNAAGLVLSAVQSAVSIAAPAAPVLTTLSKSELSNAAHAIDSAVSGLAAQSITEDVRLDRLADSWRPASVVRIYGRIPWKAAHPKAASTDSHPDSDIGSWLVTLRCPRVSIFDARDICTGFPGVLGQTSDDVDARLTINRDKLGAAKAEVAKQAPDGRILHQALSSQVTVADFVKTQSWYTTFINGKKTDDDVLAFCANLLDAMGATGLNSLDSALVLRAAADQLAGVVGSKQPIAGKCAGLVAGQISLSDAGADPLTAKPPSRRPSGR